MGRRKHIIIIWDIAFTVKAFWHSRAVTLKMWPEEMSWSQMTKSFFFQKWFLLLVQTQSSELPMTKERSQGIALGCRAILQYSLHKASAIESSHFSKVRKKRGHFWLILKIKKTYYVRERSSGQSGKMRKGRATEEKDTDLSNPRPAPNLRLFCTVKDSVQRAILQSWGRQESRLSFSHHDPPHLLLS